MTIVKTDAIQTQAAALGGCCQSDNISSDSSCGSSMDDIHAVETGEAVNNNSVYHGQSWEKSKYRFPKRDPVDVEFKDLRYTVKKINFTKCKIGEYPKFFNHDMTFCKYYNNGKFVTRIVKLYFFEVEKLNLNQIFG